MIPEVQAQPGCAHGPQSPLHSIDWNRMSPEVGVVMNYKATSAVKILRHILAITSGALDQLEEWFMKLGEITNFCGPVVHLRVDVNCVLAVPGWFELVIPKPLEIRRH